MPKNIVETAPTYRVKVKRTDAFKDRFSGIEFEGGFATVSDPEAVKYCLAQGWEMQRLHPGQDAPGSEGGGSGAPDASGNPPSGANAGGSGAGTGNPPTGGNKPPKGGSKK